MLLKHVIGVINLFRGLHFFFNINCINKIGKSPYMHFLCYLTWTLLVTVCKWNSADSRWIHLVYEKPCFLHFTAVQEERQRNKDRDGDYDCNTAANEEMPVEKILEAETAVDHKTELHSATSSTGAVSVYLMVLQWRSAFGLVCCGRLDFSHIWKVQPC